MGSAVRPTARHSPASSPGQTHFMARGKGTVIFWRQGLARVRGCLPCPSCPRLHSLPQWCPPPSQPWPDWALCPFRANRSVGGSGGLQSLGRTELSDFLQLCPWKVSPAPSSSCLLLTFFLGLSCSAGWGSRPGVQGRHQAGMKQSCVDTNLG